MALGAIPVVVNATEAVDVVAEKISDQVLPSANGKLEPIKVTLVPGVYSFKGSLLSKVYDVNVKIDGVALEKPIKAGATATELNIPIDLSSKTSETEVTIEFESTDPTEPGADFTLGAPFVNMNFNFGDVKVAIAKKAGDLATTISGYGYAAKEDDVNAANALKTKAEGVEETYDSYKTFKFYLGSGKSTIDDEIDDLADKAAKAEAAYQNDQAYNRVNAAITAIKAKYNAAVADLQEALTGTVAEYLLQGALDKLNTEINLKITEATSASYASHQAGTAVADEATNTAKVPTEGALNTIVNDYKDQKTDNVNAYNTLHAIVTNLQGQLDAVVPVAAIASLFPKTEVQAAIDAVNTKVEGAKNSAAQLTLSVATEQTAAQGKIDAYKTKVDKANAEYNANVATTTAIAAVQKKLDDAKAAVNAKVSADGQYKAQDYYAAYVENVQTEINKLTSDAAAAYKADGTGSAQTYNAGLATKVSTIEALITPYEANAIAAVAAYDALQTAIAGYQSALDDARNKMKDLAIYTDASYDYQTKLDLLQKRINDIKKAIATAKGKVGTEHWAAMIAVDADAAIATDVADLVDSYQADQNEYDANALTTGITSLGTKISTFAAKDASTLGADVATFQAVETDINTAYTAVKNAKNAINANSDFVDYTSKVGTGKGDWKNSQNCPDGEYKVYTGNGVDLVQVYGVTGVGDVLNQEIEVENGIYDIEVYATSHNAWNGQYGVNAAGAPTLQEDADNVAYVYASSANEVKTWITARRNSGLVPVEPIAYTIKGVKVENGKLKIGLALAQAAKTEWHCIQIKSLKANTASLIQGWGAKIADLNAQQTALESAAGTVEGKVTANANTKSTNSTNIGNLQTAMGTFATTYKIGQDDSTLGNRGKAGGSVTTEVEAINYALGTLETNNAGVVVTAVTDVDNTNKVGKTKADWPSTLTYGAGENYAEANGTIESYKKTVEGTGIVLSQELTGLENGIYNVVLTANANYTPGRGFDSDLVDGATDAAYVFANDKKENIVSHVNTGWTLQDIAINGVIVSDGTLKLGIGKNKAQTNWNAIQIKSLTYRENTVAALAEYNTQYLALNERKTTLDTNAPIIKAEVEANAAMNTTATTAVTNLQTAELNTLKSLKNVTNATAVSDDATALKTDPAGFKVFETGLATDKSYTAKKAAIDADITAMSNAIAASNAEETLVAKWQNNSITVVTGKDPQTQADITKTYSIDAITAAINALKDEAKAESDNWEAYKALQDNNMSKLLPDTITMNATVAGDGALTYYQGLKDSYITGKANILTAMQTSLTNRKAVADKSTFEGQIADLIVKVKALKSDAQANLKKYNEQKAAYTETQTLWNSTYTEIAATDQSTIVQSWLDELDAIQVTLTAATEAVEANYPLGKSVAEAKDFAAIKAAINDVKARQSEGYNAQIAADNKAAHESFMGNETTKGAIQLATEAYQRAVQERAKYSSNVESIQNAINTAAANLDVALFNCPTQIADLTKTENDAYAAVTSPTVFDVSQFNADATQIEQDITTALQNFKDALAIAIGNVWNPAPYNTKVADAETAIASYSADAKKDAFKDVKDLIAMGNAAVTKDANNVVTGFEIAKLEDALAGLADIDNMLAADKDNAAAKDIDIAKAAANTAYTETKAYIEGKTIADDVNNVKANELQKLQNAKDAADDVLEDYPEDEWTFDNHGDIKPDLLNVVTVANAAKTNVDNAIAIDVNNTKAYNEMVAAIAPVEAKLAEAKTAAAPYKYTTSFATLETQLNDLKTAVENAKTSCGAVNYQTNTFATKKNTLDSGIENTLTTAFGTEKAGLATDITELKNQFNTYVAANGLNETANGFKADIDDLEAARVAAAIKDLDTPADGIQFDEIVAATEALIELQNDIADKETELLAANASTLNATVLADFNSQLDALAAQASLEGYDEWVGGQAYGNTTLDAAITDLKAQIAELKAAIAAEENISFYKDNYQKQIDAIKTALEPVAAQIAAKDAQFKANAAAYTVLMAQITELQGKIDAAKAKVGAYVYAKTTYITDIEQKNNQGVLTGGAQKTLNNAKAAIETANTSVSLTANSVVAGKAAIENAVQNYLDKSAFKELEDQRQNLYVLLANAIDIANHEGVNKYSSALWARLIADETIIYGEIDDLYYPIWNSYQTYKSTGVYEWVYENNQRVPKARTSDADYEAQMEIVDAIKAEISDLSDEVDNLDLLGDANVDGKVNVLDYQKVLNMILDPALQPADDTDLFVNIDINQSTVIEVGDLTAIVNYILNHNWPYGYAAARGAEVEGESLAMTTNSLANGKQRIAVNLTNVSDYTAFQMDVVLPNGMTIVGAELSDRAGESHKFYTRNQMDGSVRMLASSVKGETFSGNEGAVLYIDVETTSEYMGGNVELLNILFSDVNAQTRSFAIGGDATGIDTMSTFEALKQKVYDLGGRVKNGLKKGINIIRRADGSTEKVVK